MILTRGLRGGQSIKKVIESQLRLFDKSHVMRHLEEALDKVLRKMEYARLSGKDRSYMMGIGEIVIESTEKAKNF